jgi:predicted RND superfamily exporter protein
MAEEKATTDEQKKMEERSLSVFASEKKEDITALIISFILAVIVLIALK